MLVSAIEISFVICSVDLTVLISIDTEFVILFYHIVQIGKVTDGKMCKNFTHLIGDEALPILGDRAHRGYRLRVMLRMTMARMRRHAESIAQTIIINNVDRK